jgi:hypothetical protein
MRRVLMPLVVVTVILVAGCSEAASPGETSGATLATGATVATGTTLEAADAPTHQALILGPGEEPVASADVAPRLFREEPSIAEALRTAVPAGIAGVAGRGAGMGNYVIVVIFIAGAAETGDGIEVYADLWDEWYSVEGARVAQLGGGPHSVTIRLTKVGGIFRVVGVDRPKDGSEYLSSLDEMFPPWVRDLMGAQETGERMRQAAEAAGREWAAATGRTLSVGLPTTTTVNAEGGL